MTLKTNNVEMSDRIRIVTTDSGLGGLSITAELYERLKREKRFDELEMIFFNCRPSDESGYDALRDNESKVKAFSNALYAMTERFSPDLIIIACNTLSAIYEKTEFSNTSPVPVDGIIDVGIDEMGTFMKGNPHVHMLLFATPTTVNSKVHERILVEQGIAAERLHYQECRALPAAIDRNANSLEVRNMIREFMTEVFSKTNGQEFAVSLLCTHFPYSLPIFREEAERYKGFSGDIINPNSIFVHSILQNHHQRRKKKINASIQCFTHTDVPISNRKSLCPFIVEISTETASSLLNMSHIPHIFSIGESNEK